MNENKLLHMIDEMSLKYICSMTDEPSEANAFCNTILNDFNKLKRTINHDLDEMIERKKLLEKSKKIKRDVIKITEINNCENCHNYNSLIHYEEGLFHQCMMGNKLWQKCNDYDAIKED